MAGGADTDSRPLSTGEYFVTMLVLGLPVVGFVLLLVWAFGGGNVNRRNLCRAVLIFTVIAVGLWLVSFFTSLALLDWIPGLRTTLESILSMKS
jgi:hypothetical protein